MRNYAIPQELISRFLFSALSLAFWQLFCLHGYRFLTAFVSSRYGLRPVLHDAGVSFINESGWYNTAVIRSFSAGFIGFTVVAVVLLLVYGLLHRTHLAMRLFLLWGIFSVVASTVQRMVWLPLSGFIPFRELGDAGLELAVVAAYLYAESSTIGFIVGAGVVLSLLIGFVLGQPVLRTATSSQQMSLPVERRQMLIWTFILPLFAGVLATMALHLAPSNLRALFMSALTMMSLLLMAVLRAQVMRKLPVLKDTIRSGSQLTMFVLFAFLVILVKSALPLRYNDYRPLFRGVEASIGYVDVQPQGIDLCAWPTH